MPGGVPCVSIFGLVPVPRGDGDRAERAHRAVVLARLAEPGAELDDGRGRRVSQPHDGATLLDEPEKRVRPAHRQRHALVGEQDRIRKLEGRQRRHVERPVAERVHDVELFVEVRFGEELAEFFQRGRGRPRFGPRGKRRNRKDPGIVLWLNGSPPCLPVLRAPVVHQAASPLEEGSISCRPPPPCP